ncbi:MAG: hypothetical protein HPY74_15220, partial [Firmicutes bacterium]|nr:hypothetical protein [Bacillota bacterium]
ITGTDKDDDTITFATSGTLYVTSATKIFKVTGLKNSDIVPVEWASIENAKSFDGVKGVVYADSSKSLAKMIIITDGFDKLADSTVYYGYITAMAKINANEYELTIDLGEEENVVFNKSEIGSGVAVDTVVSYQLNNSSKGIKATKLDGTTKYVEDVDGSYVKFVGDANYTKVSADVVVYDIDGDKRDFADLDDAADGIANKVVFYANGSGVIQVIVVEDFEAQLP